MKKETVLTNGCFDILHIGHIRLFEFCKTLGNELIVLLNSDKSIKLLNKAKERPINKEQERFEILSSIKFIDKIIIFEEVNPCKLISEIQPQDYVQGGDYKIKDLPESEIVLGYGGEIRIFDHTGHSTTKILEKLNDN